MSPDIMRVALDLLARREHSRTELSRKLRLRDFSLADINPCLDQLVAKRLLSDERFAQEYVKMRARKGFGPVRIGVELAERGVPDAIAQAALQSSEYDWSMLAEQARQKKFGEQRGDDFAERATQWRFLQYRGFNSQQ